MVSEGELLATSQASAVVTTAPMKTTVSMTETTDASAASWVQEHITGEKLPEQDSGTEKAVGSPASTSGMQ